MPLLWILQSIGDCRADPAATLHGRRPSHETLSIRELQTVLIRIVCLRVGVENGTRDLEQTTEDTTRYYFGFGHQNDCQAGLPAARSTMRPNLKRRLRAIPEIAALCGTLLLASCATTIETAPRQYFDERTGVNVTVGAAGMTFARSRTGYATNARDYFSVVPVDVNRGGTHVLYLYCYFWSTIDRPGPATDKPARFELVADDRRIPLEQVDTPLRSLGFDTIPVPPPANNALPLVTVTDREVLQTLVRAQALSLVATRDGLDERYDLWTDQRSAIDEFLHGSPRG